MIVTVTPNPALDLTWHVAALTPGATHRADAGRARAGGKGLNVARVAHAEGASVCAVVTHGGPTGEEFFAELLASEVPHTTVPVRGATRRSIAIVDEAAGDTTIVNERGVPLEDVEWDVLRGVTRAVLELARGDREPRADPPDVGPIREERPTGGAPAPEPQHGVLVISGSLPPGTPDDVLPSLIALGRDAGVPVIVDTSGPALLAAAEAGASVLKPNEHELREATGLDDPIAGARELLDRGAELVLLSRGADGMLAIPASGEVWHARLGEVLAGNPTGAGDAAVAACAVLMADGVRDPERILRRATAWSAAAVLMPLAGEIHPSWPELEASVTLTRLPTGETSDSARDMTRDVPSRAEREVSRDATATATADAGATAAAAPTPPSAPDPKGR